MVGAAAPFWLTVPAAALYGAVVELRNRCYARGVLPVERAPLPVVSVGNLVAGGSGKTPLVAWIAQRLLASGVPCAVLSRGYGRRERGPRLVLAGDPRPEWGVIGDEPWLLARRLPRLALGIDARRARAARGLAPHLAGGLFILDDGFQHRGLARDLEIVTVSAREPLAGGHLLPAGRLREHPRNLARADWVVLTGADDATQTEDTRRLVGRLAPAARIAAARTVWRGARRVRPAAPPTDEPSSTGPAPGALPPAEPVLLVAGIAHPERFAATVAEAGIAVAGRMEYADHHRFGVRDVEEIMLRAERLGAAAVLTTEKDVPRLAPVWSGPPPLWAAEVELQFTHGEVALGAAIEAVAAMGRERANESK